MEDASPMQKQKEKYLELARFSPKKYKLIISIKNEKIN